ncbi:MAG TPA: phosphatidate cytidylyltransferase [Solirubrobacteraceae bacterium]|jgi:phosphatidate cytidylyltransferase|nr:phosphatidate cytidylyltransferase [Solirubrobacteraceae bacterium]
MARGGGDGRERGPSRRRARRAARRNQGSDLGARVVAAIPLAAFAIFIVYRGGAVFVVALAAIAVVCLHELYAMFERAHPARLAGFAAVVGMLAAAHWGGQFQVLGVLALAVPLTFLLVVAQPRGGAPAIAVTLLGVGWIGLALAHAVLLRDLPHGGGIVIDVLVGTFLGDTGAYLGGRAFGATPMAPRISPHKTLEGLGIGVIVGVAGVWFAGLYQDWLSGYDALLLGLAVAVVGPIGDLFESYLKRDAGAKDAGTIFGAHGGALDRLDAVMFTIVAGFYVWSAMS